MAPLEVETDKDDQNFSILIGALLCKRYRKVRDLRRQKRSSFYQPPSQHAPNKLEILFVFLEQFRGRSKIKGNVILSILKTS